MNKDPIVKLFKGTTVKEELKKAYKSLNSKEEWCVAPQDPEAYSDDMNNLVMQIDAIDDRKELKVSGTFLVRSERAV